MNLELTPVDEVYNVYIVVVKFMVLNVAKATELDGLYLMYG